VRVTGLPQIAAVVLAAIIICITVAVAARRGQGLNPAQRRSGIIGSLVCAVLLVAYVTYWATTGGPLYAIIICAAGALCAVGLAGFMYRLGQNR
jgi:Na+-translocating ferredoxin:NAD+ oxidoreductase RnfD subunit